MEKRFTTNALILANGEFPKNQFVLNKLRSCTGEARSLSEVEMSLAPTIICCDGAVQKLLNFGLEPDIIIGDLDSISEDLKRRFAHILVQNPDQETNDLTKAVQFCLQNGIHTVEILGATGLREDHTLGNISLLANYAEMLTSVKLFTDYGVFTAISKTTTFESFPNQALSIFSITPQTVITTQNLEYNVQNRQFRSWWEGTLNRSANNFFTIEMDLGKLIIFQAYS
ncbi:MAG: thiamine diphosphokinase [Bacteroidales bacterium]|jgi:thiamine pyrophosphokinase|nr:thiamine diphosphokinase [Bacteroidales bacterium]